ncbi:hypothetical protein CEXT_794491 [Caerostris extrusa]|uniref:Uncharacterized protein n=1 Tax=Caerostris extrusa TaxID=172846 RepID=A0AAV4X645_CAEEX|nr:hypothetical protein CEXT_794491 [Caerostris extrusa]
MKGSAAQKLDQQTTDQQPGDVVGRRASCRHAVTVGSRASVLPGTAPAAVGAALVTHPAALVGLAAALGPTVLAAHVAAASAPACGPIADWPPDPPEFGGHAHRVAPARHLHLRHHVTPHFAALEAARGGGGAALSS